MGVALEEGVEGELAERLTEPGRAGDDEHGNQPVEQDSAQRRGGGDAHHDEHECLRPAHPKPRRHHRAETVADRRGGHDEPDACGGAETPERILAQQERQVDGEETDERPQRDVGPQPRHDRGADAGEPRDGQRVIHPRAGGLLTLAGVRALRQPQREHHAEQVDDEGGAQGPLGSQRGQAETDRRRQHRAGDPGQGGPGVGPHQRERRGQQPWHGGGAGDEVGLGRHESAEGRGVQRQRVARHRVGDHPHEEGPHQHRRRERVAPSRAHPVQQRPDHRRDERERCHRDEEEERDSAPRLARRHREEQRPGQGDRQQRVGEGVHRVQLDQAPQAGLARSGGVCRPAHATAGGQRDSPGVPAGAHGHRAGTTCPPPRVGVPLPRRRFPLERLVRHGSILPLGFAVRASDGSQSP